VPDSVIATAQVDKRDILAIFVERKESEVLIDPRRTAISIRRWRPSARIMRIFEAAIS
jgi:hypothetical protein